MKKPLLFRQQGLALSPSLVFEAIRPRTKLIHGGVGFARPQELGERCSVHTYLVVKEDGWQLFGFTTPHERRVFQKVLGNTVRCCESARTVATCGGAANKASKKRQQSLLTPLKSTAS